MIIFGGDPKMFQFLSDVWVLTNANGLGGQPQWMQLSPTGSIPGRWNHTAAYDPELNKMIVFGGAVGAGTDSNDVWVLANANGSSGTPAWTQLLPSGVAPPIRESPFAMYDTCTKRMILFGGGFSLPGNTPTP